jgi:uncharacterized protein (DUF2062 family)
MRSFARRRLVEPLLGQLRQGITPEKLALTLALGLALGSFPVLGVTTVLCVAAGLALRLNQPAIQVANYLAYPLQLGLLVPFFQAGAWLLGAEPVPLSLSQVRAELAADAWGTIGRYWEANLRAVAAWAVVAPPFAGLAYLGLKRALGLLPLPRQDPAPAR